MTLKDPKDWKLIGKPTKRLDTPEKITGKAQFGIDVQFPGLRTAVVARAPVFGGKLVKVRSRDGGAEGVPGVEKVVQVPNGVAVVAEHFWAAKLGRDALVIEWDRAGGRRRHDDALLAEFRELAQEARRDRRGGKNVDRRSGRREDDRGRVRRAVSRARADGAAQLHGEDRRRPLRDLDRHAVPDGRSDGAPRRSSALTPDKVTIHTTFLGGGFGRRANPTSDFVAEAVHVAKAAGVPVKVVWTREDDMRGGYYRPAYVHRSRSASTPKACRSRGITSSSASRSSPARRSSR